MAAADHAVAGETVRIAVIEMLSGPFAATGQWLTNHLQMAIDDVSQAGTLPDSMKIEVVRFDDKGSPQEALLALKQATDMDIRYVFGSLGSHIAHALLEAINKHNLRDPQRPVLFINYSALDPALTNEKCSFWHFRFSAHADMQAEALIRLLLTRKDLRKAYLINQDYAYGQEVRRVLREMLALRMPDLQIVGDDLHPLGKVKDFAPYVAKIRASEANVVLSSNWGSDLSLLVRASEEAGLPAMYFTVSAALIGTPTAIGAAGADRLWTSTPWHANAGGRLESYNLDYRRRYAEEWVYVPAKAALEMWVRAIQTAGTADPTRVARALEGMRHDAGSGPMWMRPDDHQLMLPTYMAVWTRAGGPGVKYDVENTGYGFKTELRLEAADTTLPTTCRMQRPE
jgi:branched-chain amino acid transport system substrate-binding protein